MNLLPTRSRLGRCIYCALLIAGATVSHAETVWYKVEIVIFRQASGSHESPLLTPVPTLPANGVALIAGTASTALRAGESTNATRPKRAPTRPAALPQPPVDPVIAAQIAQAQRVEAAQKLALEQTTPVPLASQWAFRQLPDTLLDLNAAATRLRTHAGYTVLRHVAWTQPLDAQPSGSGEPRNVALMPDQNTQPLDGYVALRQRGKLEMSVVAWYPAAPEDAAAPARGGADDSAQSANPAAVSGPAFRGMRETVRIAPGQVQYVDGLSVGALVRVDLVTRPLAQRIEGVAH